MAQDLAYSYAGITKSEKQADGTLKVYGKATDDALDVDQQICDETWLKQAMPDWFESGGNIREQHSNIAAGVATDYESKADGHYITALIVDPVSVKKVETGVLKGFSIGIRGPRVIRDGKAAGGRIVGGQIVEVSVVDRPANPNAKLMLAKAADGGELMAVEQTDIPTPAELFASKSADTETVEVEDTPLEGVEVVDAPVEEDAAVETVDAPAETEIVESAKSLLATLNKFDQVAYDAAVNAIADLIIVEAGEMKQGHDERDSIKELLRAAKHLAHWYEGEEAEGETGTDVMGAIAGAVETIQDTLGLSAQADKSADAEEEDGEDKPACDCEDPKMCKCNKEDGEDAEKSAAPTINLAVDEATMALIVEKAVNTAKETVSTEIEGLKAAFEAEQAKSVKLEQDLEVALTKAVGGGPKRSTLTKSNALIGEWEIQAAEYSAKAAATMDKTLAQGYRELAEELSSKAAKAARKDS